MKINNPIQQKAFKMISLIIFAKIIISVVLAIIFLFWKNGLWGLSALLGGSIAIIPQIIFAIIYFRQTYARAANKVVNAFFIGEAVKWLITIGMFTVSFQWSKLKPLPLFITFIATQLAFWLVPLIYEYSVRIHTASSRTSHSKDKLGDV